MSLSPLPCWVSILYLLMPPKSWRNLGLDEEAIALLQSIPSRGSVGSDIPTDPTIYRFYEMMQVYGTTLKALVHEQFGDGIISAINFKMDIKSS